MARDNNLTRRGAVYYVRIYTPKDLIKAMAGRGEVWRSLGTTDYSEAKVRKAAAMAESAERFDRLRSETRPSMDLVQSMVWDHYDQGVRAGDQERAERPTQSDYDLALDKALEGARSSGAADLGGLAMINAMADVELLVGKPKWSAERRAKRLVVLRARLASGDPQLVEVALNAAIAKRGIVIAKGSADYRDLGLKMMRAEIEFLMRTAERDSGDFSGAPSDPLVVPPVDVVTDRSISVMSMFGKYENENPNGIRAESMRQARRDVQHFVDFTGTAVSASAVSKRHVREWKEALMLYPVKASETNIFKGLNVAEIIRANKKAGKPTLTRQTVRRYLSSLGGLCRWMVQNDYLEANPVIDMLPRKAPPTTRTVSLTDDQLLTLFGSPLFSSAMGNAWRQVSLPGAIRVRDHRYWIPWIMLCSGARPAEIAQLQVDDVRHEHGIAVLHITEEGGNGKRTKTEGSMRLVPIHSELLRLGLLQHRDAMISAGERQLFPEVVIPKEGQIAAQFSREFGRYLTRVGVKSGRGISAYSLRHGFMDRARTAGFLDEEIGLVVGHDKPTMTGRYGTEKQGTLELRQRIVESVNLPALFANNAAHRIVRGPP